MFEFFAAFWIFKEVQKIFLVLVVAFIGLPLYLEATDSVVVYQYYLKKVCLAVMYLVNFTIPIGVFVISEIDVFSDSGRKGFRSNSAIDLQAAQRAKVRAQYAAMARNKITSGTASLRKFLVEEYYFAFCCTALKN